MTIGLVVSKPLVDQKASDIATDIRKLFRRVEAFEHYLLITSDATLKAMGYTDGTLGTVNEIATLKSAIADAEKLRLIWMGLATQPATQDFRLNLDQLAGTLVAE